MHIKYQITNLHCYKFLQYTRMFNINIFSQLLYFVDYVIDGVCGLIFFLAQISKGCYFYVF